MFFSGFVTTRSSWQPLLVPSLWASLRMFINVQLLVWFGPATPLSLWSTCSMMMHGVARCNLSILEPSILQCSGFSQGYEASRQWVQQKSEDEQCTCYERCRVNWPGVETQAQDLFGCRATKGELALEAPYLEGLDPQVHAGICPHIFWSLGNGHPERISFVYKFKACW